MLLFTTATTSGQVLLKFRLSEQAAGDLLKALNKKLADTTRIDILLKLADYHLQKENLQSSVPDLNSAATVISNAKEINARQRQPGKRGALILLREASLSRRSDNASAAIPMLKKVIAQLQTTNDGTVGFFLYRNERRQLRNKTGLP
jgi:hypothetical protein